MHKLCRHGQFRFSKLEQQIREVCREGICKTKLVAIAMRTVSCHLRSDTRALFTVKSMISAWAVLMSRVQIKRVSPTALTSFACKHRQFKQASSTPWNNVFLL